MALLGSVIFNTVFYLSLIPISISIIILYFFLSTKKLQAFGALWIWFVLWLLRIMCGVTWVVEGKENIPDTSLYCSSQSPRTVGVILFTNPFIAINKHYKKRASVYSFFWLGIKMYETNNIKSS